MQKRPAGGQNVGWPCFLLREQPFHPCYVTTSYISCQRRVFVPCGGCKVPFERRRPEFANPEQEESFDDSTSQPLWRLEREAHFILVGLVVETSDIHLARLLDRQNTNGKAITGVGHVEPSFERCLVLEPLGRWIGVLDRARTRREANELLLAVFERDQTGYCGQCPHFVAQTDSLSLESRHHALQSLFVRQNQPLNIAMNGRCAKTAR